MKLIIEDQAYKYILEKGYTELQVNARSAGGCCSIGTITTSIQKGQPKKNIESFKLYQSQGISLYVPFYLEFKNKEVRLGLESFLGIKSLVLTNLDAIGWN